MNNKSYNEDNSMWNSFIMGLTIMIILLSISILSNSKFEECLQIKAEKYCDSINKTTLNYITYDGDYSFTCLDKQTEEEKRKKIIKEEKFYFLDEEIMECKK